MRERCNFAAGSQMWVRRVLVCGERSAGMMVSGSRERSTEKADD
jgi:hypothetical protein